MKRFGDAIEVFMLKTDINDVPVPFICHPCGWNGTSPSILPIVTETISRFNRLRHKSDEETLVIHLRRNFSRREIRSFIAHYFRNKMQFLLFVSDCLERSDMVMNTLKDIYGTENISIAEKSGEIES
ncbi:hypothetical protein IFU23_24325 [Pantoea agglomerans]|uniref:Uncharacterized protein n=1 Tax=Enterobacter agglomerans TaxID=549 RepID=A0ACC5PX81_ENTAG|nr:hypothetical protein [Pantoea agglomerans]MBD8129217.1 hypothetical protein [Pantoea agglomerans]MBD8156452.1 hypothetical protein [Pantoea agglomerans]MBD8161208.1 hypothetical protein [Pantoea agglomerans]MBD8234838.1 hypothetical protein [Pantoea agglomerans]MBD8245262.1 hypothetical protein [Pantoea agglomerans]